MRWTGWMRCLLLLAAMLCGGQAFGQENGFIGAPGRRDVAYDDARRVLYISQNEQRLLRFDMATQGFLPPLIITGAELLGMDTSPDGNLLAVADGVESATQNFVHLIDLRTGSVRTVAFTLERLEGGTFTVAFGSDGKLLVSSSFNGSGFVPLRSYDPATDTTRVITNPSSVTQDTMLSASGDRSVIGFAESNISDGRFGRYRVSDGDVLRKDFDNGTGAFNFEIGTSRNGNQYAIPTFGGTFIYDGSLNRLRILNQNTTEKPIGVAYNPISDRVYFPYANTSQVRVFSTLTFEQLDAYEVGATFDFTGNRAFVSGRTKISRDGTLLFVTVNNGVHWRGIPTGPIPTPAPTPTPTPTPNLPPSNDALNPLVTTSAAEEPRAFITSYSDPNGAATLKSGCIIVGNSRTLRDSIFCFYDAPTNKLFLVNQNGRGVVGSATPGERRSNGEPLLLSHGRGSLDVTNTIVRRSGDGRSLNIEWRLLARVAHQGAQPVELFSEDLGGLRDGWDRFGTWNIQGATPTTDSLTPSSATDAPDRYRTFTATYSDLDGANTLKSGCIVVGDSATLINSLFCFYDVPTNRLFLVNENLRGAQGGFAPGVRGNNDTTLLISNSMGTLDITNTTVTRSADGRSITIGWRLAGKTALAGRQAVSLLAEDTSRQANASSGWRQFGTWTIQGNVPPRNEGVTPRDASISVGNPQVFTTTTSDANGWQNLGQVFFRVNSNGSNPDINAIVLRYDVRQNRLYLRDDASTQWIGGFIPGTNTGLSNSQGTLNVFDTRVVSASGNQLVLRWSLTGAAPFRGPHTLQLGAIDIAGAGAPYSSVGSWTIQ